MSRSLLLRILSAALLIPVALAAAWAGGLWFAAVVAVFALGMAWEWGRICDPGVRRPGLAAAILLTIGSATAFGSAALIVPGAAAAAAGALLVAVTARGLGRPVSWMAPVGAFYIAAAILAVLDIRGWAAADMRAIVWLFAVVWATDIAAYAAGRTFGGPLLAPRFSPRKTWSGMAGGAVAAALAALAVSVAFGGRSPAFATFLGFALAFVAQAGDLAESAAKRYAGIKDASALIPGHGGVLDRLDGLMAAALAFALLRLWMGEDLLGWR